ncbi:hypothetical protein [uncultured Subdoligranulum sp.]|uniref:hypothetical protein n=1 Tax=uncultured Subdoligranulum sp. TaxID=512298 RepID=UPI0025DB00D2|nr:hypothetical protein [uncultured Subdoligranulum sp.]
MADERRDSLDQLTDAARAASKVAKIVQAAQAGGAAGAAAQTIKEYHKQAVTVIVVVLLLPVLLILSLPAVVFGSLMAPSDTVLTDEMEIAENVIEIKNSIGTVLQTAYEDVLAEIEDDSKGRYAIDVVDPVGGQVSFNALEILSMYCAHMGATEYEAISIDDLTEQVKAHQDEYYSYTAKTETKTEMVDKIVDGVPTKVPETHDYTTYTISYAGDNYFADTIWQLDETERAFASDYAQNLTLYLQEIDDRRQHRAGGRG